MKNIMLAVTMLTGLSTSAFGKTIAEYSFNRANPSARLESLDIVTVTLEDDHDLKLVEKTYARFDLSRALSTHVTKYQLSDEVFQTVLSQLSGLADVEVVTTHSTIVCMMMPMPGAPSNLMVATKYNYETKEFDGAMRLVLSKEGCYLSSHTAPKDEYAVESARSLRSVLQILSLQVLNP